LAAAVSVEINPDMAFSKSLLNAKTFVTLLTNSLAPTGYMRFVSFASDVNHMLLFHIVLTKVSDFAAASAHRMFQGSSTRGSKKRAIESLSALLMRLVSADRD
jgi:hypothetical protein